jgi:hypothetical protein
MRHPLILAAVICALALPATRTFAQFGGGGGGGGHGAGQGGGGGDEDDAAKKKRDEEWAASKNLDLPGKKNAGPCPYVKVLYDAARYVELQDNKESMDAVGYTGEIQNLSSGCAYRALEPIHVATQILFAFGRGPAAEGRSKDFHYWVAVTDRNFAVLDKEYFTVHANFPPGQDRVTMTDQLNGIDIPRANSGVSGANFEILIGFDVTPQMADFNRQGKRFLVNVAAPTNTASAGANNR